MQESLLVSKNKTLTDPYLYPGSSVLINKFSLKNQDALQEAEGLIFGLKNLEPLPAGNFDYDHLKAIHNHFFHDVYAWAGQERTVDIAKGNSYFGNQQYLTKELNKLFLKLKEDHYLRDLSHDGFCEKLSYYFNEINAAHPFREGNGRTQRAFCDALAKQAGYELNWTQVNKAKYIEANIAGFLQADYKPMELILKNITTSLRHANTVDETTIEKNTLTLLKQYVSKQLELTETIKQKGQLLREGTESAKSISQKVLLLNSEAKQIAKTLIGDDPSVKKLMTQSQSFLLNKKSGFAEISERLQNNTLTEQDIQSVLRHAKHSLIAISHSLNQKNSRTQ